MAIADYFHRGALAAAQVIHGFDEHAFRTAITSNPVGIALAPETTETAGGRLLADLTVRILSRLYPKLVLAAAPEAGQFTETLADLARRINPSIELTQDQAAPIGIAIGDAHHNFETVVYAGADQWLAYIGEEPQLLTDHPNPFGPGAAASFASANLFRFLFLGGREQLDNQLTYSTYTGDTNPNAKATQQPIGDEMPESAALVGAGAIGNAAAWALSHVPMTGKLFVIDPENIEASNLQRYVLAERADEHKAKIDVIRQAFRNGLQIEPIAAPWEEAVGIAGFDWQFALLALDSAADRRAAQASLPKHVLNAWTQSEDLGVSVHGSFLGPGACVSCLYMPASASKNEDQVVAEALRIPEALQSVRRLLHSGEPPPPELLELIAERLDIERALLAPFENRPLRSLFSEGVCGGAVISLDQLNAPGPDVHVPLAHQSALAGIQLAAFFARHSLEPVDETTLITRIDLLHPIGADLSQPALKGDSRCICADSDYVDRYQAKWHR